MKMLKQQISMKWHMELQIILNRVINMFDTNSIQYTLICGNLLGAARQNSQIAWDNDVDLLVY